MDKKFAIFDMDGTLIDSMSFWKNLASEYLASKGIHEIPEDILEAIKPMTRFSPCREAHGRSVCSGGR